MCGVAGYVGAGSQKALDAMVRLLAHRGPDASGTWSGRDIGLAHTRLAILDLSPLANQPMADDGSLRVTFNGEIYNFRELRDELQAAGYNFRTRSDTEVLLRGYRHWGEAMVTRLRGMFALALWDDARGELFLARDRLGIKPLFYVPLPDGLVFASEIKALFAHPGVAVEMDPAAVDAYVALGHVPKPATIFRDVKALLPGQWLRWQAGRVETGSYWAPDFR